MPPPTVLELEQAIRLFVDPGQWDVTRVEAPGRTRWNSAYTDHWPKMPDGTSLIQAIHPLEGWEVTFQAKPKTDRDPRGTTPKLFQVLIDKDSVIHWRKPWQGLPSGLESLGS
jgi:hypothetical protein